jgi:hypothetical protein
MSVVTVTRPLGDVHRPIDTVEALREHLQWAFLVEFSTIPPYLTALYSIQDKTADVYSLIRSVALEEMLHLNLASNLLNGTGATPKLVGHVPEYPTYLTHHAAGGPYIQLMPASVKLMTQTFMAIELPAPFQAPAEGDRYQTIGQFYKAIDEGFERCVARFGAGAVFRDTGFQRVDYDFANSGGRAIYVHDLASARLAIREIVQQGEGAETQREPYHPDEPWGGYEHYGMRPDGTYGPILGTPLELSHYFKFKAVADGVIPLPAVYPMAPNPEVNRFENPIARQVAEIFNGCYGVLVRAVELAFSSNEATDPYLYRRSANDAYPPATAGHRAHAAPCAHARRPDPGPHRGPALPLRGHPARPGGGQGDRPAVVHSRAVACQRLAHDPGDGAGGSSADLDRYPDQGGRPADLARQRDERAARWAILIRSSRR